MFCICYLCFFSFSDSANDQLLDRAIDMLDPDLRPIPPQPNCPQSMQIYEDHRLVSEKLFRDVDWFFCRFSHKDFSVLR